MGASKKKSLKVARTWGALANSMKPVITKRVTKGGRLQAWHAKLRSCGQEFKNANKKTSAPVVQKIAEKVIQRVEAAVPSVLAVKPKEKKRMGTTLIAPLPVARAVVNEVKGPSAGVTHEELAKRRGLAFDEWEKKIIAREKEREQRVTKVAKDVLARLKKKFKK